MQLCGIWSELLERLIDQIDVDFDEAGGDSVALLRLAQAIAEASGVRIEIADLLQSRTVRAQAQLVRSCGGVRRWSPLVVIRSADAGPPIIAVHPFGGSAYQYLPLARCIPSGHPFYCLQAFGLEPRQHPLHSIRSMARSYVKAVTRAGIEQPVLIGWSFGALVAYEMARVARKRGTPAHCVVLIEPAPAMAGELKRWDEESRLRFWKGHLAERGIVAPVDFESTSGDGMLETVLRLERQAGQIPERFRHLDEDQLLALLRVQEAHGQAFTSYVAGRSEETVWLLRTEEMDDESISAWRSMVAGPMTVHRIAGDHATVLEMPHCRSIARVLDEVLGSD